MSIASGRWVRVLIASKEGILREGLLSLLKEVGQIEVSATPFDSPPDGAAPDVIVCIVRSSSDVERSLENLAQCASKAKLFFLCLDATEDAMLAAWRGGAMGIVNDTWLKPVTIEALAAAVRNVADGQIVLPQELGNPLLRQVIQGRGEHLQADELTRRERDVLSMVAEGLNNREVALALSLSEHTVRAHLRGIMQKLQVNSRAKAVALAWKGNLLQGSSTRGVG